MRRRSWLTLNTEPLAHEVDLHQMILCQFGLKRFSLELCARYARPTVTEAIAAGIERLLAAEECGELLAKVWIVAYGDTVLLAILHVNADSGETRLHQRRRRAFVITSIIQGVAAFPFAAPDKDSSPQLRIGDFVVDQRQKELGGSFPPNLDVIPVRDVANGAFIEPR